MPHLTRRAIVTGLSVTVAASTRSRAARAAAAEPAIWTAAPMTMRLRPDANSNAELWAFNQQVPGPVLRARQGEEVRLRLVNETPKPLSLHWQGVRGPDVMDGVGGLTQDPVAPGQSFEYRFVPPDSGTVLVRPCVIGGSAEPTERGLTSLLIVDEATPVPVDGDLTLLIDDWLLEPDGSLAPFEAANSGAAGRLGNWLSVNGQGISERIEMRPGSRLRLRLANACNARVMRLRFEGLKPYVAAIDGQPTDAFEPLRASLPFAPGTRYDILLDLPRNAGESGDLVAMVGTGIPLLRLVTKGEEQAPRGALTPLPPNPKLPPEIKLQGAVRKDVVIGSDAASGPVPPTINGRVGSPSMPALVSVKRGTPVVLALVNRTPVPQPVHLHGHVFRLLHPYDDGWDPYFFDTLLVPENRTVRIAFVADNPGRWLLASTVLERFDAGLWTWIEVT